MSLDDLKDFDCKYYIRFPKRSYCHYYEIDLEDYYSYCNDCTVYQEGLEKFGAKDIYKNRECYDGE